MAQRVIVKDFGWQRITEELKYLDKSYSKVGFPENMQPGQPTKKGSKSKASSTMTEVVYIALIQNYGTKQVVTEKQSAFLRTIGLHVKPGTVIEVPAREFMSSSFVENLDALKALIDRLYVRIINGKITTLQALMLLGEFSVSKMKRKIRNLKEPPNHPVTIARKGSSNPLIDTAQMINSITHTEVLIK